MMGRVQSLYNYNLSFCLLGEERHSPIRRGRGTRQFPSISTTHKSKNVIPTRTCDYRTATAIAGPTNANICSSESGKLNSLSQSQTQTQISDRVNAN
nr:hypothetical protein CFP56_21491 [Quercus suber]